VAAVPPGGEALAGPTQTDHPSARCLSSRGDPETGLRSNREEGDALVAQTGQSSTSERAAKRKKNEEWRESEISY